MRCAACATENKSGRQFCAACGAALSRACAQCGFVNEPADKFCGGCGVTLAQAPAAGDAAAERRPVAIMFVDLAGYTTLSEKIDPEETHALLGRFFALADDIILQFGGRIDKHIGDNVMALFGAPIAHGDDPQRAVSAAQAIHAAMPELAGSSGHDLAVHIGIAMGEVLASGLGSAAHSTYTVIGPAVNLAARLMELAAPGETLAAPEIARHLDGRYVIEQRGAQAIKGLSAPVEICRIGASLSTSLRATRPIVGRRAEIRQICALLDTVIADSTGSALLVRGVPGIGKSHLADEAAQQAERRGFQFGTVRVLDFGAGAERDPHRQLARALAQAAGGLSELSGLQYAVLAGLTGLALDTEAQQRLDAMSHAARHAMRAEALAALLSIAAARQPLFLDIEDVHWADANFLATLASLTDGAAESSALLLMTSRLDPNPIDAAWRAGLRRGHVATIDLAPISVGEALEMSRQIGADLGQFAQDCVARAEGNPLFLEQLLRSRLSGESGALPDSLQNVVLARVDQLPESERQALQVASVLGQQFRAEDLARLLEIVAFDGAAMVRRQLLRPVADGYLFAHALIHDGIYTALTRERRRALHRRAAALYAGHDPLLHAEHLDRAEAEEAASAYLQAADSEAAQHRLDRAARLASRGLELARSEGDRCRLGIAAGRRHLDIGAIQSARPAFEAALAAGPPDIDRCRGLIGLAACDRQAGAIDQALAHLAGAEPIAEEIKALPLLAEINYLRGNLHFARGAAEECLGAHEAARRAAETAGEAEWLARAESGLGDANYLRGRFGEAQAHFQACVTIAEGAGLLRILPSNRCMMGNCHIFYCRFDDGLREVEAGHAAALRIGDRFGDMFGLECIAFVLMTAGRWQEAERPAEAARRLAVEIGAKRYESIMAAVVAMARKIAGDQQAAEEQSAYALRLAEETGIGFAGALIEALRANILEDPKAGCAAIARGVAMLRQTSMAHNHIFFHEFAIDWAVANHKWSLAEAHADALAQFTASYPLPYADLIIHRARVLAQLSRDPDDPAARSHLAKLAARARAADFRLSFPE